MGPIKPGGGAAHKAQCVCIIITNFLTRLCSRRLCGRASQKCLQFHRIQYRACPFSLDLLFHQVYSKYHTYNITDHKKTDIYVILSCKINIYMIIF